MSELPDISCGAAHVDGASVPMGGAKIPVADWGFIHATPVQYGSPDHPLI